MTTESPVTTFVKSALLDGSLLSHIASDAAESKQKVFEQQSALVVLSGMLQQHAHLWPIVEAQVDAFRQRQRQLQASQASTDDDESAFLKQREV